MEFPDLGAHCSEPSCKRLDFLPLKCDACEQLFCTDHVAYAHHNCTSAYKKDVQVPVCPLCSTPIPVKRGEMPDIVVGAHIDQDCKSDPAQRKRKIFTNKCQRPGCKQREMMKVLCDQCHGNFCLKHRHPLDHDCAGAGRPFSKAGSAAIARAQRSSKSPMSTTSSHEAAASTATLPATSRAKRKHYNEPWKCHWQTWHPLKQCPTVAKKKKIWPLLGPFQPVRKNTEGNSSNSSSRFEA
uniref:Zinc finger AN1-type containing 2B n=1 Tax=Salvator merianae TaxID=96440 RepID=A0A8D0BXD9_SALMN